MPSAIRTLAAPGLLILIGLFAAPVLGAGATTSASPPVTDPAAAEDDLTPSADEPTEPRTGEPDTGEPDTGEPETGEAPPTTTADDDTADGTAEEDDVVAPDGRLLGLPSEPPPGFSEEQYRRFVQVVSACGLDGGRVCEWVLDVTGNDGLAEVSQWVYDVPLRLLVIAAIAFAINRLIRRTVTRYVSRTQVRRDVAVHEVTDPERIRRDALRAETVAGTIGGAATIAIATIAAMVALGELGVTLGPLLAGAGIVGIALGFGAQNLVRDVFAGLFVILEDQYGVGDIIDTGRATGKVEGITLRITKVRDIHGTLWFVPNGVVSEVGNHTQLWSRAIIDFDIDYRADHERASEIIKATADRLWRDDDAPVRILEEPELWGVESLGDSSVVIRVAVKTAPAEQWQCSRVLRGEVKKALDAEGIEIPFPQQTVWIHADPELRDATATGAGAGADHR